MFVGEGERRVSPRADRPLGRPTTLRTRTQRKTSGGRASRNTEQVVDAARECCWTRSPAGFCKGGPSSEFAPAGSELETGRAATGVGGTWVHLPQCGPSQMLPPDSCSVVEEAAGRKDRYRPPFSHRLPSGRKVFRGQGLRAGQVQN